MANISHIKQAGKYLGMQGIMHSSKKQLARPTILDAFKTQLKSDKMIQSNIRKIRKEALAEMPNAKNYLIQELKEQGLDVYELTIKHSDDVATQTKKLMEAQKADVVLTSRVKQEASTRSKMNRSINEMKTFNENPNFMDKDTLDDYKRAHELFKNFFTPNKSTQEKYKFLVGDQLGLRISANIETKNGKDVSDLVFKSLGNLGKKNQIKTTLIENYHGEGIAPYTTEASIEKYFDIGTTYAQKVKKYGYTRVNSDIKINGVNGEFQYGGKHTTPWGEKEHIFHDKRTGKSLNTSHFTPEQKELANKITTAYEKVINNPQKDEQYALYLRDVWKNSRLAEQKGIEFVPPTLPDGIDNILSIENVFKL